MTRVKVFSAKSEEDLEMLINGYLDHYPSLNGVIVHDIKFSTRPGWTHTNFDAMVIISDAIPNIDDQ